MIGVSANSLFHTLSRQGKSYLPGMAFCLLLVVAASYLSDHYGLSKVLGALLLGMAFHSIAQSPELVCGIEFCAKTILRLGVVLLAVRISFSEIFHLGFFPLVLVLAVVVGVFCFSLLLGKVLKVTAICAIVSGVAVGICGVSAALAVAAVLPMNRSHNQHLLCTSVAITTASSLCMLIYPGILEQTRWDSAQMGMFLGATIHDVAQVFGAGQMLSADIAHLATYTKMLRVALLVPVIFLLAYFFRTTNKRVAEKKYFLPLAMLRMIPPFLIAFLALIVLVNSRLLPAVGVALLSDFSQVFLLTAIAAIGARTDLVALCSVGIKPFLLVVLNTLFVAGLAWFLIQFLS